MNPKPKNSNLFLISFLPALAYWYLESNYDLKTALIGGIILGIAEILFEKIFVGHVHTISKFNFYLILLLGGVAFLGDDGVWFKLQPAFTGIGIGFFLFYRRYVGKSLLVEMMTLMQDERRPGLPPEILSLLEKHMSYFFVLYGLLMGYLAIYSDTGHWLFFKTAGFYLAFFVFFIIEILMIRKKIKL